LIKLIFALLVSSNLYAAPKELEVWFVSHSKVSAVQNLLDSSPILFQKPVAELQCEQMGEYCFDPQYGLYKKDDANLEVIETSKIQTDGPIIPTAKSVDREVIDCDKTNAFDMFCGKSKKDPPSQAKLDLWIDTSSSMKEFDYSDKDGSCHRKSLVHKLDKACGFNQKVNVMMFDTSIKQAGDIDQLCNNQGLNDYKRLMDWIERSDARKLVVITDLYELHKEFSDFVEKKNGKLRGDKDALTAKQLLDLADQLVRSCK
jgi:hypothetical protein